MAKLRSVQHPWQLGRARDTCSESSSHLGQRAMIKKITTKTHVGGLWETGTSFSVGRLPTGAATVEIYAENRLSP